MLWIRLEQLRVAEVWAPKVKVPEIYFTGKANLDPEKHSVCRGKQSFGRAILRVHVSFSECKKWILLGVAVAPPAEPLSV